MSVSDVHGLYSNTKSAPWGTEVYPGNFFVLFANFDQVANNHAGVNAHNHQHMFCLRVDPQIDGQNNTIFQVDAVQGEGDVGSEQNPYGNAFYAKKTKMETMSTGMSDYNGSTSRTWEMANTSKLNAHSKKPVGYKLVSREVPSMMPKKGGIVWKRAGFARHAVHVTKCKSDQYHNYEHRNVMLTHISRQR